MCVECALRIDSESVKGEVYLVFKLCKMKYIDKYAKIMNRSQIKSFNIYFSWGKAGRVKISYFLNNQLKFDIKINIFLFYGMDRF